MLIGTFTALFLPGYTQEVSVCSPPTLELGLTAFWPRCEFSIVINTWECLNAKRKFRCDRTVKVEGYYFVFLIALGHVFLTMR